MKNILEALKNLLPANQVDEVVKAVEAMVAEAKAELEAEFDAKLKEAYEKVSEEVSAVEAEKESGYQQAYDIISEQMKEKEVLKAEYEQTLEEEFEVAHKMIEEEKSKNKNLEVKMYEEFQGNLQKIRELMIDRVDEYLHTHNTEMYEHARKDLMNDPRMVEQKVALNRIMDVLGNYVGEEEFSGKTSNQLEEATKVISDLKSQMKVLESRNVRLSMHNSKLNENVQQMQSVLTESTKKERTERTKAAGNASGRGQRVLEGETVIAEFNQPQLAKADEDQSLVENNDVLREILVLSGVQKD
jgi:regulator of replication initiation timing